MRRHDRELMMKLAFYALYEPSERAEERTLGLLVPLPRELSERRLKMLLDAHFTSEPTTPEGEADESERKEAPNRRGSWRAAMDVGSILALAAAVLLVWLIQRSRPTPELAVMPGFTIETHEIHPESMRGAWPDAVRCPVSSGNTHALVVCLIPASPVDERLAVAAFAEPDEGDGHWLALEHVEQSDEGVLTIEEPIEHLGLSPGHWRITFYITHESRRTGVTTVEAELELGSKAKP